MVVRIQLRHDIASAWTTANPILLSGEVGVETDTSKMKIGIGQNWANTPYFDATLVHINNAETIHGDKSFTDKMVVGTVGVIPTGKMLTVYGNAQVTGEIEGIVSRAYEDGQGNVISDYYQKKLAEDTTITDGMDWNLITEEGVYNVNITTGWNPTDYHDPSQFSEYIGKQGILIVHADKNSNIIQRYIPLGNNSAYNYTVVTRYLLQNLGTPAWSTWVSQVSTDSNVVHTTEDENINGVKVFQQETRSSSGIVNFSSDISGMDSGVSARLQRAGTDFIIRETNGELRIGAGGANIYLRPSGINVTENQVVIDNNGVIEGKCTKDGNGNVITTTYATKEDIRTLSIKEPEFIDSSADIKSYNAIRERKRDTFGDFIDIIKKDNYTVVGTPTITTGVMSDISNADYIELPTIQGGGGETTSNEIYIQGAFVTGTDLTDTQYVYYGNANNYFRITNSSIDAKVSGIDYNVTSFDFTADTPYTFTIALSGTMSNLYINEEVVASGVMLSSPATLAELATQIGTDGTSYFKGYIDLNAFRISKTIPKDATSETELDIYEAPIYQPCLQIPYTASRYGVKIVDGIYSDRTLDCYNQYRTGNYFILDTDNNKFRLPFDSPNGLNHIIEHWRSSSSECEYDTNLECSQSGSCTNGTPVVFHKPYADNNYSLIGITYSAKTATGFTPSADGYYNAKGRITLG